MSANATILLVDDEAQIRKMLRIALRSVGYQVQEADGRQAGLTQFLHHRPDLVILDLGLPDGDGMQLLADIRRTSHAPVLVLSVRQADQDKVQALDHGAQDYVSKPFSMTELLARVRALLRDRLPKTNPSLIGDGHLMLDLSNRLVTLAGTPIELTPKEYAVLARLAANPNGVVTQQLLLEQIWGPSHREDSHYLRIVVSHLRQKLGDDATEPRYLQTDAGIGYRLMLAEPST